MQFLAPQWTSDVDILESTHCLGSTERIARVLKPTEWVLQPDSAP